MANDEDELITSPRQIEPGIVSPAQVGPPDLGEMDPDFISVFAEVPEYTVTMEGQEEPVDDIEMPQMDFSQAAAPQVSAGSVKTKGITERGKKAARGIFGQEEAKAGAEVDAAQAWNDEHMAAQRKNAETQKRAIDEQAAIDRDFHAGLADIRKQQMGFQFAQVRAEEIAFQKSQAFAAQHLANYKTEMAGVRQLMMQTGNPLGKLDMGSGMALGAAMFAQGFLGARGINVDVTGQVNRWIEREMAAHQQMIQNRQEMANSNLTLYGLARQNARDEAEVRERLRGFVLDGLKANIYMEAAKYKSASALADAHAKAAAVDNLILANDRAMHDRLMTDINNIESRHINSAAAQARASVDWAEYSLKKAKEDREAQIKEGPSEGLLSISDPGRPIRDKEGNVVAEEIGWTIDPTMDKTEAKDVRKQVTEKLTAYKNVIKAVGRARAIRDKYMGGDVSWVDRLDPDSATRRYEYQNEMQGAIRGVRHAMAGAQLTGFEKVEWDKYDGVDNLIQLGTKKNGIDQLEQQIRDDFVNYVEAQPGIQVADGTKAKRVTSASDETGARLRAAMGDTPAADQVQQLAAKTTDTARNTVNRNPGKGVSVGGFSPFYYGYVKQTKDRRGVGVTDSRDQTPGQRQEIDAVDGLVRIYLNPQDAVTSTTGGKVTDDLSKYKTGAFIALQSLAKGEALSGEKAPDEETVFYAKKALEEINNPWAKANPEATYRAFSERIHVGEEEMRADFGDFFDE